MVYWYLLTLTALLCCVKDINAAATYTMLVNNDEVAGSNGVRGGLNRGSEVLVACRTAMDISDPDMIKITPNNELLLNTHVQTRYVSNTYQLYTYTLTDADKHGIATYRCIDKQYTGCPDYSQVTISFSSPSPSPGAVIQSCPPGGASDRPSVNPSSGPSNRPTSPTSSDGTVSPKFAGLNPLIYTISAVILLGTLAIVAIITCWIRARRSYNRRMFQSTTNPQDYLDYINDNEFTPLTTSEFVASLQERPPTYNESEEIEGQTQPEGSAEDGTGEGRAGGGASTTTITTTTNARNPPPRPPPPSSTTNSNRSQPTTSSSSGTTAVAATSSNEDAPDVTSEDCSHLASGGGATRDSSSNEPSQRTSRSTGIDDNDEDVPDITEDSIATGGSSSEPVLSGVDALLSMDLTTGNGNGTPTLPILPASSSSSATESAAIGTLIDFGTSDSGSNSKSTFHSLPQPTPEQISEMEAAIGALNEHMTRIRERTE